MSTFTCALSFLLSVTYARLAEAAIALGRGELLIIDAGRVEQRREACLIVVEMALDDIMNDNVVRTTSIL